MNLSGYLRQSAEVLEAAVEHWKDDLVQNAIDAICGAFAGGKSLLVCGNGGSASDAMHITGELVGRFLKERKALRAICLSSNPSVLTAWANDYSFDSVFSRQVEAYGEEGGVILGISTSGNSTNVVRAFEQARAQGMKTIALTGQGGGLLALVSDHLFAVPSRSTPHIQQVHICLYHYLCGEIEARLTDDRKAAPDTNRWL